MGTILGFLPFIAFSVLESRIGAPAALILGALIALGLVVRSRVRPPHSFKILEVGTVVLMAAVALYAALAGADLSLVAVRLSVDGGLLLIVLISIAIGQPFTLQYAREQVDRAYWDSPRFLRVNTVITTGWAVAFAIMIAAEGLMLLVPGFPQPLGYALVVAALVGAFAFTNWYSKRAKAAAAA
jgi:hypothetical protein